MEYTLSDFKHSIEIQSRFSDIDGLAHVNNSVYYQYFDIGRVNYFQDVLGVGFNRKDKKSLVLVSTKTDYGRPAHLWDKLSVYTKVYKLGVKSVRVMQWVVRNGEETPLVVCDSVMSGFAPGIEQSIVIPDEWKELLKEFENIAD